MNSPADNDHYDKELKNNQNDDETIKLVNLIFRDVVKFPGIAVVIPPILERLYDSFLSIALTTPNLFAIENHQARLFLKAACQTSVEWDEKLDNNKLYLKKIESIVENIIETDVYESKTFIKYQNDLEKILIRLKKRQDIKQKRLKEKTLGQEKIKQAQDYTNQLLSVKFKDIKIPVFFLNIFTGEWTNVLVLLHIRHGFESVEYQSKLKFVDLLMTYFQSDSIKNNAKEKIGFLKKLYQEGLELVAFNQREIPPKVKELFDNLNKLHHSKTVNKVTEPELVQSKTKNKKQTKSTHAHDVIIKKRSVKAIKKVIKNKDYSKTVDSLKTGTWFEFVNDDKSSIKAKLSWISPITGNLLFVDSRGLKLTDKTREELIAAFESKTVKIIN